MLPFRSVLSSSPAVDHELVREAARPSGARPVECTHILLAMGMQALTHAWTLHLGRRTPHDRIPLTSPLIRPFDRKLLCCCARTPHVQWDAWDHLRERPFARMRRPFAHMQRPCAHMLAASLSLPSLLCSLLVVCSSTRSFALLSCIIRVLNRRWCTSAHSHFSFVLSFACSSLVHPHTRTCIRAVVRVLIRR